MAKRVYIWNWFRERVPGWGASAPDLAHLGIRSVRSQRTLRPAPAAGQIWKCSLRFGAFSDSNLQFQCGSVAIARGAGPREVSTIESRFPRETFVEGSEEITIVRPRDASLKPRLPLLALLKAFCAQLQSMSAFLRKGLKELLAACGFRLPADLATSTGFTAIGVTVKPGEASEAPGARAIRRRPVINSRTQSTVDPVVSPCVFVPFCCVSSSGRGALLCKERVECTLLQRAALARLFHARPLAAGRREILEIALGQVLRSKLGQRVLFPCGFDAAGH